MQFSGRRDEMYLSPVGLGRPPCFFFGAKSELDVAAELKTQFDKHFHIFVFKHISKPKISLSSTEQDMALLGSIVPGNILKCLLRLGKASSWFRVFAVKPPVSLR